MINAVRGRRSVAVEPARPWEVALLLFVYRLSRLLRVRVRGWRLPLLVAVVVFLTSWLAMSLVEPAGSEITGAGTYWWYFVVTAATVGYGDVFPSSTGGRVVGTYVIVGGIVTLTLLFTQLANALQSVRGRRSRGVVSLDLHDHVVLLGYTPAARSGSSPSSPPKAAPRWPSAHGTTFPRTPCPTSRRCTSCAAT